MRLKKKIKIGLLLNEYTIPAWAYEMIVEINASHHSELILVVKKKTQIDRKRSFVRNIWRNRNNILFSIYPRFEDKYFKTEPNAFEPKNLKNIVNCTEIEVEPKKTKFSDFILKDDIDRIKKYNIDVFIRLGFRILRGEILNIAKYGVWSYHHGDNKVNRGGPAGVWEVINQWKETGVILQILTEDLDGGIKLYESFSSTDLLSIKRNKNNYYWNAKSIIPRKLQELFELGEKQFSLRHKKWNTEPLFYYNRLYTNPKNYDVIKGLLINYWKYLLRKVNQMFFIEQWILLFKFDQTEEISQSFYRFKRIIPPKDRDWADPFVIQKNNKYYIFIEEFVFKENLGKISVFEMDESGNYSEPVVILEKDYHLSYPFLLEDSGELYMIPETSHNNTIELYKCTEFPTKWKLFKVLINNVLAVDSTLFKYNNKFWLFTNIRKNPGASKHDELFLFYSDSLLDGEWKPHPQNPIISDVKFARPAGNIFVHQDRIFRPAQNCAKHYGHGMQIREIVKLSEIDYEERQLQSIYPNWEKDLISTHTLNFTGKLTVIDALIKRRRYFKS